MIDVNSSRSVVLFDLDGVLVDSRRPISECINHALAAHGLSTRSPEALFQFIGPPLTAAFAELIGEPDKSPLVRSCVNSYRELYAKVFLRDTEVVPGIVEALNDLRHYRLAVATSKPRVFAEPLLDALGLRGFFELCAGPELGASSEEKAVTISVALERLGSRRGVMVGDRDLDVIGARRCSLPAIAVTWGIGGLEELEAAGPDAVVNAPEELSCIIGELAKGG